MQYEFTESCPTRKKPHRAQRARRDLPHDELRRAQQLRPSDWTGCHSHRADHTGMASSAGSFAQGITKGAIPDLGRGYPAGAF